MKWSILLDSPDICGGNYVIFQHALYAKDCGDDIALITKRPVNQRQLDWHPESKALNWSTVDEAGAMTWDAVVATSWPTVFQLALVPARTYVYFVQSIESRFFPPDDQPRRALIDSTYLMPLHFITEAGWIRDYIEASCHRFPRVVRNGIRKDIYTPGGRAFAPIRPGFLRVLIEGPLHVPFKNVDRTLELCRRSNADEIWLLTSTPLSRYPHVDRVFSRIPIADTAAVYRSCDVLVKLSYLEGMFGPPLEMFHCGGTAIVYEVTGSDEYIRHGHNALVIPRDNECEVIESVNRMKEDSKLLFSLKEGAAATAAEWPDWRQSSSEFRESVIAFSKEASVSRREIEKMADFFYRFYELAETYRKKVEGRSAVGDLRVFVRSHAPAFYARLSRIKWFLKSRCRPLSP
jgi:hypothetical protein